jgi:protein-S-isoprenylcysteine O-methyltransferase Ste14
VKESAVNQVKSFILPVVVLIIIPGAILWATGFRIGWGLGLPWDMVIVPAGALLMGAGLYYLSVTIWLFNNIGRGTLAPWSPTRKLVVLGPYRYVRNPMISGVLMTLLGESVVFGSIGIFIWFLLFFIINHIYFIYSEEPGLERRFGQEYLEYKKNVPRWVPRLRPWNGQ